MTPRDQSAPPSGFKVCTDCKRALPRDQFAPHSKRGTALRGQCRRCVYLRAKAQRLARDNGITCRYASCGRPHYALGYCQAHYRQVYRYGKIKEGGRLELPWSGESRWKFLMEKVAKWHEAETDDQFAEACRGIELAARRWGVWATQEGVDKAKAEVERLIRGRDA